MARLETFITKASRNNTRLIYALKCDVKKFFDSIDQDILLRIISAKIQDSETLQLVTQIVRSFEKQPGVGLPLGNVTSQLFANIYLNVLDQFLKHRLKVRYYVRYCDDFIILGDDPAALAEAVGEINDFLKHRLNLSLHPRKITIRKHRQGIDFLGYVILPHHRVLRTRTKRRIFKKAGHGMSSHSLQSYLGIFSHAAGRGLKRKLLQYKTD